MDTTKEKLDFLEKIFENINHWLGFAEAKNAALVAFNIALAAALSTLTATEGNTVFLTIIILICLIISSLIILLSFIPKNTICLDSPSLTSIPDNLIYYGNISKFAKTDYIKAFYRRYWDNPDVDIHAIPKVLEDYFDEILTNAKITCKKQIYFKCGAALDITALILISLLIISA